MAPLNSIAGKYLLRSNALQLGTNVLMLRENSFLGPKVLLEYLRVATLLFHRGKKPHFITLHKSRKNVLFVRKLTYSQDNDF
jgi:hypothetical protein